MVGSLASSAITSAGPHRPATRTTNDVPRRLGGCGARTALEDVAACHSLPACADEREPDRGKHSRRRAWLDQEQITPGFPRAPLVTPRRAGGQDDDRPARGLPVATQPPDQLDAIELAGHADLGDHEVDRSCEPERVVNVARYRRVDSHAPQVLRVHA